VLACEARKHLSGRLHVTLTAYPPDRRRRDIDNLAKSVLDAMQHAGVYLDDSQIDRLTIIRAEVEKGGIIVAKVEEQKNG
jgi:crossover junction endodeoxyribonuclease RusA